MKIQKNLLVKISGDGLKSKKVLKYLRYFSERYERSAAIVGGGTSINEEFRKMGFEVNFCPLGRTTSSNKEIMLAEDILKENRIYFQNLLDEEGINIKVVSPGRDINFVHCPENGDVMILSAYLGFDKIIIFTEKKNLRKKRLWVKEVSKVFEHIAKGKLNKIKLIGF